MRPFLLRRWAPWVALVVAVSALLFLAGAPAVSAATSNKATHEDSNKKKDEKADDAAKKGADKKEGEKKDEKKEEPKELPFDKVVKDAKEVKGLFTVYIKEDEAKYFLEIAPDQFNTTFLLNPTLVSGLGDGFLYPSDMWPEYPVQLQKVGKTVRLIHKNPNFRADGSSLSEAAGLAAPEAIVSQTKIESLPHPDRKSVLVDMSALFVGDLEGLSLGLKGVLDTPYAFDGSGSNITQMQGYPANLDFDMVLNYKTQEAKIRPTYAADPRSLLIRFHYSLSKLPDAGYRPRLADDRVGHFLTVADDYSNESADTPAVRYVNRWRLEKKDPSAALSEPKQPIVYYLEKTIPPEYRDAVKRGIEGWQAAFEAAGFKNAIVARDQPDDPNWNAADVRYASIRWIVAPGAGFAQGPSRVNPYTGEIFDADIRFSADLVRNFHQNYQRLANPVALSQAPMTREQALLRSLVGWTDLMGALSPQMPATGPGGWAPAGARAGRSLSSMGYCDLTQGFMQQMAAGLDLMQARGQMTPEAEMKFVNDALVYITLHEVGHTLGLRHNFKSSSMLTYEGLQDTATTTREGLSGSVMDYIPANLAPEGKTQGQYFTSTVGPYDKWAIEYAYKNVDGASPEEEKPALDKIASRVADPKLAYGTDEDSYGGLGIDPMVNQWDLSGDALAYARNNVALYREMVSKMETKFGEPGTRYQRLRQVYATAVGQMVPPAANVTKYIGGIRHNRDHMGDPGGRLPYDPVPASQQREALDFLSKEILGPDAFKISPRLLNKLAIERLPDLEGSVWMAQRNDFPMHNLVLAIQSIPLNRLYSPATLNRLNDMEARMGGKGSMAIGRPTDSEAPLLDKDRPFTMAEMFSGVRKAIWSELQSRGEVNSFRRNLQRAHLDQLVELAVKADPNVPEDARTLARADLTEIRRGIDATLVAGKVGPMTRAHLDETKARINAALAASLERQLPH